MDAPGNIKKSGKINVVIRQSPGIVGSAKISDNELLTILKIKEFVHARS